MSRKNRRRYNGPKYPPPSVKPPVPPNPSAWSGLKAIFTDDGPQAVIFCLRFMLWILVELVGVPCILHIAFQIAAKTGNEVEPVLQLVLKYLMMLATSALVGKMFWNHCLEFDRKKNIRN